MVDLRDPCVRSREKPEPHEDYGGIPLYIMTFIVLVVIWGAGYILFNFFQRDFQGVAVPEQVAGAVNAQQIFNNNCAACHQASGLGITGVFPPLSRSEWVIGDDTRVLARILLNGMSGPVTVAGVEYNSMMPPFGAMFSDEELAALGTYIRSAWDNNASPLTEEVVAEERAANKGRGAWIAEELKPLL